MAAVSTEGRARLAPGRAMARSVWLMAIRPRTLTAAVAPVLVGSALAHADGAFALAPAAAALACAVLIQIGTNLANDYYDYVKGADTAERLGAPRVTQMGLLAPSAVKLAMLSVFGAAVVLGAYLVSVGGWPILAIGVTAVASGILYTGGPWPLGYHGLGEVFVFVFFGLVAVAGTYFVQAGAWSVDALIAGAAVGSLATAVIVVNNLRDIPTDAKAGKHTLAVMLGVRATRIEYVALLAAGAALPLIGVAWYGWSAWSLLALTGVAAAAPAARRVLTREGRELNTALGMTAGALGLYGALLAAGLVL